MIKSERGSATLESVAIIVIFVAITGFSIGFFGLIHTAILNSIGARAYAFETFRNRSDLVYFRHKGTDEIRFNYSRSGNRTHGVQSEKIRDPEEGLFATERPLGIGMNPDQVNERNIAVHNTKVHEIKDGVQNQNVEVSPVWVMIRYGICLNSRCGDERGTP